MKKPFVLILLFAMLSQAQIKNWGGYLDTTILWINNTTTVKYSKIYNLTEAAALSLVTMANDTAAAGFANDSTKILYGFQVGGPVLNASGTMDTAWGGLDTLDTLSKVGYGATQGNGRYSIATDLISETWGLADTSKVTGYAYQIRPIRPYNWDVFIRAWYVGQTGTRLATPTKVVSVFKKMIGIPTVSK
jgi:hypothetical protein